MIGFRCWSSCGTAGVRVSWISQGVSHPCCMTSRDRAFTRLLLKSGSPPHTLSPAHTTPCFTENFYLHVVFIQALQLLKASETSWISSELHDTAAKTLPLSQVDLFCKAATSTLCHAHGRGDESSPNQCSCTPSSSPTTPTPALRLQLYPVSAGGV